MRICGAAEFQILAARNLFLLCLRELNKTTALLHTPSGFKIYCGVSLCRREVGNINRALFLEFIRTFQGPR